MATQGAITAPAKTNVNKLGYFLDGWADLIEDRGDKAQEARQLVFQYLKERNMPDITVAQRTGTVEINPNTRPYNITTTHPGATTAIYVGQHGKDLYVSWRTFIAPVLNTWVWLLPIIAAIIGIYVWYQIDDRLRGFLFSSFSSGSNSGSIVVGFLTFLIVLSAELYFVGWLGRMTKGTSSAYFFVEPNIFDAEDITAMSFAAHKSILRALDKTGIDTSQLRLKQQFKGGRTTETV